MAGILSDSEKFKKALEAVFENPRLITERGPEFDAFLDAVFMKFDLSPKESEKILHILETVRTKGSVQDIPG